MLTFRPFHNSDPPRLVHVWRTSQLGRGAAQELSCDWFDELVLAAPYFDRNGLIVAEDGPGNVVGFVHAGFGSNAAGSGLDRSAGVIAAVVVHPDVRRRGIGRELVKRAEQYLSSSGSTICQAGERAPRDPFYLGLYGGSESLGVLESDLAAAHFFASLGYGPTEVIHLFSRNLSAGRDPFDPRLLLLRRKVAVVMADQLSTASWWWLTRQGRVDAFVCALEPKSGGPILGSMTVWGMELMSRDRKIRTVGIRDIEIRSSERRKGLAKMLLIDSMKLLRDQRVECVEVAISDADTPMKQLLVSLGFVAVDRGLVLQKPLAVAR